MSEHSEQRPEAVCRSAGCGLSSGDGVGPGRGPGAQGSLVFFIFCLGEVAGTGGSPGTVPWVEL